MKDAKEMERSNTIQGYLRENVKFPHVWCAGCGNGVIMSSILRAVHKMGWKKDEVVMVSGIGCSSRMPTYIDFNTLHTTHGRAIPFATGLKLGNPSLQVIVVTGDGDCLAIGGNHFIHACRRNMNLTVILVNNYIYGMTGGQYSPTMPKGDKATTAPYGNVEPSFDASELAKAAGANYVARTTVYHAVQMDRFILQGLEKKGFSFIEVLSDCPTLYGRLNKKGAPTKMLEDMKNVAIPVAQAANLPEEKLQNRIITGVLSNFDRPDYLEEYQKVIDRSKEFSNEVRDKIKRKQREDMEEA